MITYGREALRRPHLSVANGSVVPTVAANASGRLLQAATDGLYSRRAVIITG